MGFALEDRDMRRRAQKKLVFKRLDAIILNSPENISSDQASVQVKVGGGDWERWPVRSKSQTGVRIVRLLDSLVGNAHAGG